MEVKTKTYLSEIENIIKDGKKGDQDILGSVSYGGGRLGLSHQWFCILNETFIFLQL